MNFFSGRLTNRWFRLRVQKKRAHDDDSSASEFFNVKSFDLYDEDDSEKTQQTYILLRSIFPFKNW